MAISTTTGFENHMRGLIDNMVDIDNPTVKDTNVNYVDVASSVGKALNEAEKNALRSFAFNNKTTQDELSKLGVDMGMSADDAKTVTLDGLRLAGQSVLNQAKALYEMFTNLLASKKRTEDSVIANLRN